jgi:hypothetical protein
MCFGNLSPIAARTSAAVLSSRLSATAKPLISGIVSMSQTRTCAISCTSKGRYKYSLFWLAYSQLTDKALLSRSRSQKSTAIHTAKIQLLQQFRYTFFTLPGSEYMTTVSNRRSSFGMKCIQCGDELLAPEWSEYRNERQVHHVWRCWKCDCCFETFANIESIEDIETSDDIFQFAAGRLGRFT